MTEADITELRRRNRIKGAILDTVAARLDHLPMEELEAEMASLENGLEVRIRFIPTDEEES